MRKLLKNFINKFINPLGLTALKSKDYIFVQKRYNNLATLYNKRCANGRQALSNSTSCIVFSKDRSIQLHALLSSYFELVTNPAPVTVLYHTSSTEHYQAYRDLADIFVDFQVHFQRQHPGKFKEDLLGILSRQKSDKIFFLVDDMLFVEKIDLDNFTCFDTDIFVPSLRLGQNLNFCYTLQQKQPLPNWLNNPQCPPKMMSWSWQDGKFDWAYPLSVDGHLFGRWEILAMTELLDFTAPNTYEIALQQFSDIFETRIGIAYKKSAVVNIPWNKVQKEHDNLSGSIHQDHLLAQWRAGKQIDYQKIYGLPNFSAHQEVSLELKDRKAFGVARKIHA